MDPFTIIAKETLGVIHLLGHPVCRLVYNCSVSERLDTTERTLDKAFNEIHQKDVLPNIEPDVIAGILATLTAYVYNLHCCLHLSPLALQHTKGYCRSPKF